MATFNGSRGRVAVAFLSSLPVLIAACGAARADDDCIGFGSLSDGAAITSGRIADREPRDYFVKNASDMRDCPNASAACRAKAFLVPGDVVILGRTKAGFVCVDYLGAKGADRAGWLPAASIVPDKTMPVTRDDWVGTWTQQEASVTLKPGRTGELAVHGDATYGALDPERVKRGGVNIGEIDGTVTPKGDALAFTVGDKATLPVDKGEDTDCKVWMRRTGPFLLVQDNTQCGGANVSFGGIYRRAN